MALSLQTLCAVLGVEVVSTWTTLGTGRVPFRLTSLQQYQQVHSESLCHNASRSKQRNEESQLLEKGLGRTPCLYGHLDSIDPASLVAKAAWLLHRPAVLSQYHY